MLMDIIKSRHSIRKYRDEQISVEDLNTILEAGNFAPSAGGGQRSMMVAIHDREKTKRLGIMNLARFNRSGLIGSYVSKEQPSVIDDPGMKDGFYGAATVVCVFSQGNFLFKCADAFCIIENMVLQATELGIASCIVSRGEETFAGEEGRALMREWGVPENYICQGFVALGYVDGEQPSTKPRKPGRVVIVE
ncbi:MAG: nitroreductase family protein [Lachnospiraceae bacterium]|nr:nitroreductase family protein [Lachnospiraceae bacterium]